MEQEIKTPEEAVQNTRRIGLVILAVLLLLLAVGGIVLKIALTPDDAFERILHETVYDYDEDADMTYFITDGKLMDAVMEGYVIESASDADGRVTAVLNCTNELFILKDKKLTKAAGGVVEFRLASGGTAAAYIQEDGTTALYDITRGTSRIIEASRWCGSLTLSPDGGTLMLLRESELGTDVLCIWRDGTLTELAAHALPIAVADDARYAYYRGASDNSLYVSRKLGEPVRLTENFDNMMSFCFDRELEEFFFSTWDGLFVSVKGREPVQVYDMSVGLQLLCPPRTAVTTLSGYVRADIYPVKTFAGQPVLFEMLGRESKDLVYLDEEYQQQFKLEAWDFTLTPDNRTLYYLRGPELFMADMETLAASTAETFVETVIAENVEKYHAPGWDGDVYFVTYDGVLSHMDADGKSRELAEDVSDFSVLGDGQILYTAPSEDGGTALFRAEGGKARTAAEAFRMLTVYDTTALWRVEHEDGSWELWRIGESGRGKRLRKVEKE